MLGLMPPDKPLEGQTRLATEQVDGTAADTAVGAFARYARELGHPDCPLSSSTVRAYRSRVRGYLGWLRGELGGGRIPGRPLDDPEDRDLAVRAYGTHLIGEGLRSSSVAAIRSAVDDFYIRCGPGQPAGRWTDPPPKTTPATLGVDDQKRWLETARIAPPRDRALAFLAFPTGLRINEIAGLTVNDLSTAARRKAILRIPASSSSPSRIIHLEREQRDALEMWRASRAAWPGADTSDALFPNRRGQGLSTRTIHNILGTLAEQAGISPFEPRQLRHTVTAAKGARLPRQPFPPIEPYAHGHLDVSDGNQIYWETSGNPDGKPALWVHGGPGSGGGRGSRQMFNPEVHRIVLFDQRGCGESRPHASDARVSLEHNTTEHLIADMERLREHLGIDRWLIYGGSWGSTLALAYAERYPQRVSEIVLVGVTMTRPEEIDWLYQGAGRLLPAAWERFCDGVPETDRDGDLVTAYTRLLSSPDEAIREKAARAWCGWEDAVIAHETLGSPGQYSAKPDAARMAFARICAHYFANYAWLEDGQLLRDAHRLDGIPAVLIHGRLDLASPLKSAWELAKAWPDAELKIIEDAGHTGSSATEDTIIEAIARFSTSRR